MRLGAIGTLRQPQPLHHQGPRGRGHRPDLRHADGALADEPFSKYGLLAAVEVPDDRSWVIFHLQPEARWHDGKPITADDVIWTFNELLEKGTPIYRFYYGNVAKAEKTGPHGGQVHLQAGRATASCR